MAWAGLGIRWTIGDVSERGFEALRLSIWGAWRLFERAARYRVCVNSVPLERALALTGPVPDEVRWQECDSEVPAFLRERFDAQLAEGVGWKFAPLRCFPDTYELALDNDCILWDVPVAMRRWLRDGPGAPSCLLAADVRACFGRFSALCGTEPLDAGIRGLPPGLCLEAALRDVLDAVPGVLCSELDARGMQAAALRRRGPVHVVALEEVSLCSPFPPHQPGLGRCGAHFVGLNARRFHWRYYERPAEACVAENWDRHRTALYSLVGLPPPKAPRGGRAGMEARP